MDTLAGSASCLPPLQYWLDPELGQMCTPQFPQRPGAQPCDFHSKTGHCKFGQMCHFDHPAPATAPLNAHMLPLRPGRTPCGYYMRYGLCRCE